MGVPDKLELKSDHAATFPRFLQSIVLEVTVNARVVATEYRNEPDDSEAKSTKVDYAIEML